MNEKILFEIIARVFNTSIDQISLKSNPETIENWDSFSGYVLLDEIESAFNVSISMEDTLEIKNVKDFKDILIKKGINFE